MSGSGGETAFPVWALLLGVKECDNVFLGNIGRIWLTW